MSTQIFINPDGCRVEYTKISAHSFSFQPELSKPEILLYGGFSSNIGGNPILAVWSRPVFDYSNNALAPTIFPFDKSVGIPLPINLVAEDVVTISGTAVFNNYKPYIIAGWNIILQVGVNYFNCEIPDEIPSFTFIPLESFVLTDPGTVCFETSVTLNSNFDVHQTRFLVGFNIIATCPDGDECSIPGDISANLSTVSYTFDIQRPCAVNTSESNFIIRNCCEPIITELVNIPGLQVGNFHVDDEGNCWEVMSASQDVTNFTRNFVNNYISCQDCIDNNPCPENLAIGSCCVQGQEFVTGSLPGLEVGDTFVDNNGLCWSVSDTTGAPISEESITVGTEITGDCIDCTDLNPCPSFWFIRSCCAALSEIIATTAILNIGDAFVDTNGICWSVEEAAQGLPTNYDIVVDTVYSGGENCADCKTANLCPLEYFITVRACCDPDRIEVISVPTLYMSFSEGTIFSDPYNICWEVMSYSTTGVETYPINFTFFAISVYENCLSCSPRKGDKIQCRLLYQVRDCDTNIIYTAQVINASLIVGSYYFGQLDTGGSEYEFSCFEVLGYGYPTVNPLSAYLIQDEYLSCEECTLKRPGTKTLEIQPCCGGDSIIVTYNGPWTAGIGGVAALKLFDISGNNIGIACYTLIGLSSGPVISTDYYTLSNNYSDCIDCLNSYPCD
jgi:hypothetical protein